MLIFSEEHYVPTDINMMVLKGRNDEGYFYIHRMLYDQAVILNDIYGDDPKNLIMAITNKTDSRADVDYFLENAPVPINIFGPFLLLVKEEITDFIDMIGAIHVMSMPINLRAMLKVPYNMRTNVYQFSLSIKEEYKLAWDRWFILNKKFEEAQTNVYAVSTPMSGTALTDREEVSNIMDDAVASSGTLADPNSDEAWDMDDVMAFLNDENFDFDAVELDDEEEEKKDEAPAPVPTPVPAPEPEPVVAPPATGVDALLSL